MAPPKWAEKAAKYISKKTKKLRNAFDKKRSGGAFSSATAVAVDVGAAEEGAGVEAGHSRAGSGLERTASGALRRLKSMRSGKWDPDILAAWGGK